MAERNAKMKIGLASIFFDIKTSLDDLSHYIENIRKDLDEIKEKVEKSEN